MDKMNDWKDYKDDMIEACENDYIHYISEQREKCKPYIDSISSIIFSNGKDINEKLAKISKKTEYLFYMVHTRHVNVDFNNLQSKMLVYMLPINISRHKSNIEDIKKLVSKITKKLIKSSFNGNQESSIKLAQSYIKSDKKPKYTEVMIEGSISSKVSFLTISKLKVVYLHDLKCENLYLSSGVLISTTAKYVRVNNFYTDANTYSNLTMPPAMIADQFTLIDVNTNNISKPEYKIAYLDLFWGVQYSYNGIFDSNKYNWNVSYSIARKFSLICNSYHIVIEAVKKDLLKYKDVNITITDKELINSAPFVPKISSLNQIIIESIGFETISETNRPSVSVNYDKSKYSIDTSKSDLDVSENSIYSYKPKNSELSGGTIIAIIAIVAIVIIIVIVIIVVTIKRRMSKKIQTNEPYDKTLLEDNHNPNLNNYDPFINNFQEPIPSSPYYQQQENQVYYPTPPYPPPANYGD